MNFDGIKKDVRETLSEPGPNGTLSWGRVASSALLIAAIVWVSSILIRTHALPALDGITAFVLSPYASNKLTTMGQSFSK